MGRLERILRKLGRWQAARTWKIHRVWERKRDWWQASSKAKARALGGRQM